MNKLERLFIVKMGGELISKPSVLSALCKELAKLKQAGINIVLVHGGGQQISEMEVKLGKKTNIVNGRRITDEQTLDITKMVVAGKINIEIVNTLQTNGIQAVGLSGVDGNILNVVRRIPKTIFNKETLQHQTVDYGFVGEILSVNPALLLTLLNNNYLPVIAPLASDENGVIYNINADTVASSIALSLNAEQLIILSNIDGVYDTTGNTLTNLTCKQARELITQGCITKGMIPKIEAIISAIQSGLRSAHIINGLAPQRLNNILVEQSLGTLIYE